MTGAEGFAYIMATLLGLGVIVIIALFIELHELFRRLLSRWQLLVWSGIGLGFIAVFSDTYVLAYIAMVPVVVGLMGFIAYGRS